MQQSPLTRGETAGVAAGLRDHGGRLAVSSPAGEVTFDALADRVDAAADLLGPVRRLVVLAARNDLDSLITYLAALRGGHVVLLAPGDGAASLDALVAAYAPDVVASGHRDRWTVDERHTGSAHVLHPDLALLLSTSGTTGSSKLVRLSRRNLDANAATIAEYLAITDADRAMTSLPMHYCYGLSVINSHLRQGAGLVLTDRSVVDRCFWDGFRAAGATSFAGVPYTFDLLERVGFEEMSLPTLRYVTQAGGRLAPDRVRRYAELGRRRGWDFFVMYGQTEATARMAYLPPDKARSHPSTIGVPIPGGSFRIDPLDATDDAVGELVYRGPNVMLGYAERPTDLALGPTIDELATGDIARRHVDGLYELVGRRSRFVKLFGLRVDLDHVEAVLRQHGIDALCAGTDETLAIAVAAGVDAGHASRVASKHTGLPPSRAQVATVAELPRLATGKPDYPAVTRLVTATSPEATASPAPARTMTSSTMTTSARTGRVRTLFASVLGCAVVDDGASFVSLGGDSLSYVEMSIRLEDELGTLPPGWHTLTIRELARLGADRRGISRMETNVALRAIAIALIVGTHAQVFQLTGGAHVLIGVAGFNFARFALQTGRIARSIARIAVPSMCWIGLVAATSEDFSLPHVVLLNAQLGAPDARWEYWFVEALVQILVGLALLLAVPAVRRFAHRRGGAAAALVLSVGLAVRFDLLGLADLGHRVGRAHEVLWLFAAGWAAAQATSVRQRLALSAVLAVAVPGFFGETSREVVLLVGMLLLIWVPQLPLIRPVTRVAGILAGASLYIYLTHWEVHPALLERFSPTVAWVGSLAVGAIVGTYAQRLVDRADRWRRHQNDAAEKDVAPTKPRGDMAHPATPMARRRRGGRRANHSAPHGAPRSARTSSGI